MALQLQNLNPDLRVRKCVEILRQYVKDNDPDNKNLNHVINVIERCHRMSIDETNRLEGDLKRCRQGNDPKAVRRR